MTDLLATRSRVRPLLARVLFVGFLVPIGVTSAAWAYAHHVVSRLPGDVLGPSDALAITMFMVMGMLVVMTLLTVAHRSNESVRRGSVAASWGWAAMWGASAVEWAHLGGEQLQSSPVPVGFSPLGVVAWVIGLAAGWWAAGRDASLPSMKPLPEDVPRLDVGGATRLAWFGDVRASGAHIGWEIGRIVLVVGLLAFGASDGQRLLAPMLAVVWVGSFFVGFRYRLRITGAGMSVTSWLRWPSYGLPISDIESASVAEGNRLDSEWEGHSTFLLRNGPALWVRASGGRTVVLSVDDPEEAAATLNTIIARARQAAVQS